MTVTKSTRLARQISHKLLGQAGKRLVTREELEAAVIEILLTPKPALQQPVS